MCMLDAYRFGFNGQEKVDEISGVGNHNTALFWEYDTRLGRRWNLDPKPNVSISGYAVLKNNPILFTDVNGDSVFVMARKLDFPVFGGAAVHTFVMTRPDNDPKGKISYYSFYEDKETGKLVKSNLYEGDVNFPREDLKGEFKINTPKGLTDEQFRNNIDKAFNSYENGTLDYSATASKPSENGNCNSSTTTLLVKSGVPLQQISKIDPNGYNPGIGIVNNWAPKPPKPVKVNDPNEIYNINDLKRETNRWFNWPSLIK
jgi:hypothetical protein